MPRETPRRTALNQHRAAVERKFGQLKHKRALCRTASEATSAVRLHADLPIFAKLALALARSQPLARAVWN